MSKIKFISSDLICSECGNITPIPRKKNFERNKYHIKDFYCHNCDKITKHIELKDADLVKSALTYKPKLTEFEKNLLNLMNLPKSKELTLSNKKAYRG